MMNFSDFADERPFRGEKIRIDDILNQQIIVKDYRILDGTVAADEYLLEQKRSLHGTVYYRARCNERIMHV